MKDVTDVEEQNINSKCHQFANSAMNSFADVSSTPIYRRSSHKSQDATFFAIENGTKTLLGKNTNKTKSIKQIMSNLEFFL